MKINDRVCRRIDVFNERSPIRKGKIIRIYDKVYNLLDGLTRYYPELYDVQWDDGIIEKGFLRHGLTKEN